MLRDQLNTFGLSPQEALRTKDTPAQGDYQRQDGTAGASFEVIANTIRFLSPRDDGEAPAEGVEMADTTPPSEDIPF